MKKLLNIVVIVILGSSTLAFSDMSMQSSTLIPQTRIDGLSTVNKYNIFCQALYLYQMDAIKALPVTEIKHKMKEFYKKKSDIFIDLEGRHRKGWTRIYPLNIGENTIFIRVFKSDERVFQEEVPIIDEAKFDNGAITVQIIPTVNTILKAKPIKPLEFR
ncbi:MAG: hypothetical protein PHQ52_08030 [Candidatus Omnitrophica bacterium]|nr:hypothetical protein [Candidatus Omnitrophota bacterium]